MAELGNMAAELAKGKNIGKNLSGYAVGLNSLYNRIGFVKLAMNVYTFSEMYGGNAEYAQPVKSLADAFSSALRKGLLSDGYELADEAADEVDAVRNSLIARMEILTAYADRFRLFEYVLNRIEYNYKECDVNPDYYEDKFERDILNYILSDKENSVVNMKIGQVVEQIPMRLSKNKFFDLLHEAFTVYKGAEAKSVEDFVYMLRSTAMLYRPDQFDTAFPELFAWDKELSSYHYEEMSEEDYKKAENSLANACEYIEVLTDMHVLLTETVNDAYTVLLSVGAALLDSSDRQHCLKVICTALHAIEQKQFPGEDEIDSFVAMEGVQERLFTQIAEDGYALDSVRGSYMEKAAEAGLTDIYERLFKMERLNSGSSFMDLGGDEAEGVAADEDFIEKKYALLQNEFAEFFANHERIFNRAVMAEVLGALPVFFNNIKEVESYVHTALGQCRDEAERKACVKIMLSLMDDD